MWSAKKNAEGHAPQPTRSLVGYTSDRLRTLCNSAGFGEDTDTAVETFCELLSPWGDAEIGQPSKWVSEISDDNTPVEFSVAIADGRAEVRVLFEPQGTDPTLQSYRAAGLALNDRLEREFGANLDRFRQVQDLFLPDEMNGPFAVWSSVVFSKGRPPSFKAYFNPQARGPEEARSLIEEALHRLGLKRAWPAVTSGVLQRGHLDELKYFALDLTSEANARVKIYVRHHRASPSDLESAASVAESYVPGEALEFVRAMRGGNERLHARAPFTCSSFVGGRGERPVATTLYVPVCAYAHDDASVRRRVCDYLVRKGSDTSEYKAIVDGFANRPLEEGVGMQAWVALRHSDGRARLTVYLATEANRVHAPGVVPAPTSLSLIPPTSQIRKRSPMRRVMDALDRRTAEFADAPVFHFLRDRSIEPRKRLAFAPCIAHFVMTFADLYALVLREEPAADKYQELVNAHTREDENHWRWFLSDLEKLGYDPLLPFSGALKFVWSDATVQMRLLSYHMCRLGFRAESLRKLVLVHCIEAAGKVMVGHAAAVGAEFSAVTGQKLVYLGQHHSDTESEHTLEDPGVHHALEEIEITPQAEREFLSIIDETFRFFTAFTNEMLQFAKSARTADAA